MAVFYVNPNQPVPHWVSSLPPLVPVEKNWGKSITSRLTYGPDALHVTQTSAKALTAWRGLPQTYKQFTCCGEMPLLITIYEFIGRSPHVLRIAGLVLSDMRPVRKMSDSKRLSV